MLAVFGLCIRPSLFSLQEGLVRKTRNLTPGWQKELHILPLWTCPVKSTRPIGAYPLYKSESEFVVDFGFYASWELEDQMGPYFYNKKFGKKLVEYDGLRCLYSATFYDREKFLSIYDKQAYDQVKANIERPDPFEPGRFEDGTYLITIGR